MCGIAGAIDLRAQREFPASRLLAMTGAIAHRGPDDEHIHIEPGLALGARRLSIVDLAGGRQPLCNEDGSIWVTQNGEIFEYPELQQELLARGHTLSTRCDTELWVHLYEDLREGMFARTRGQFAVALWDRKTRTLILGRDRVGICPLHYAEVDGWLLWGSEIKALLASRMIDGTARPQGYRPLLQYLLRGDQPNVLRRNQDDPAGALSAGARRQGRAQAVLGPRFSRCRQRAQAGRSDAAGRRAGAPDAHGRRAPAAGRRAGGQLHQRRPGLDRRAGPELARAGLRRAFVHDRAGPGRPRRAVARGRIGRGPRLEADDRSR